MARQLGWESIEPQKINLEYRSLRKEHGGHESLTLPCARTGMDNPPQVHGNQVSYDVEILSETPAQNLYIYELKREKGAGNRRWRSVQIQPLML